MTLVTKVPFILFLEAKLLYYFVVFMSVKLMLSWQKKGHHNVKPKFSIWRLLKRNFPNLNLIKSPDLVKFVMYTLVSRDCVPFCKAIKRHVYPENQGTHDKLNQIPKTEALLLEAKIMTLCWNWKEAKYKTFLWYILMNVKKEDLVKFVMCTLVFRVHMTYFILT